LVKKYFYYLNCYNFCLLSVVLPSWKKLL
jgi:hypothetical protein